MSVKKSRSDVLVYSQLSLRRTPLGAALSVRLREVSVRIESQIKGVKKGRDQL